jgi:hypothetical protein
MTQASIDFWTQTENRFSLTVGIVLVIAGLYRYKKISFPSKVILYSNIVGIAINMAAKATQGNGVNYPVFLYLSYFTGFILLAMFYNYSIPRFRAMNVGIYVFSAGFLFWACYSFFFQPMAYNATNHSYPYYVAFSGFICLILSIWGLYLLFEENTWKEIRNNEVFWFVLIYLFGTGFEFIYDIAVGMVKSNYAFFITSIFLDNIPNDIGAISTIILFLVYPKKVYTI